MPSANKKQTIAKRFFHKFLDDSINPNTTNNGMLRFSMVCLAYHNHKFVKGEIVIVNPIKTLWAKFFGVSQ